MVAGETSCAMSSSTSVYSQLRGRCAKALYRRRISCIKFPFQRQPQGTVSMLAAFRSQSGCGLRVYLRLRDLVELEDAPCEEVREPLDAGVLALQNAHVQRMQV